MLTQNIKPGTAMLCAITVLSFTVRVWGAHFGLPYDFTADEPHQILQALKIGAGEGGPLVRMTYSKNSDGSVRQFGEQSTDKGQTWKPNFDFTYRPSDAAH